MWNNSQEAGLITSNRRLNNNNERSDSCETSNGRFHYVASSNHVDSQSSMRFGLDDTAGLDEVLDNVNRLLASLNSELDDACSDDENKSDVSSSGVVGPSNSAGLIAEVRAKTTPGVTSLNEDDAKAGADKQDCGKTGDKDCEWEKEENELIELQSRSDECPSDFLLEKKLHFHSLPEENGLQDGITSKQWTTTLPCVNSVAHKNGRGFDLDLSLAKSVPEKPRPLPKAKSQGALCIGSLNLAKSVACNELQRQNHSVSVDRSSPVISRHQSFRAYNSSREDLNHQDNDFSKRRLESAVDQKHEEDLSPSPRRKSKQKTFDRIESWFTAQQDVTSTEDAEPVKQTKRFSSLTHSAPFKFAQQFIPGSREKRKLSGTKSLPVTRKSLKQTRQRRTPITEAAEVPSPPSFDIPTPEKEISAIKNVGCLLIDDEEGQVGQKPPTGIPSDSAASGNWVKQKFSTINKSFLLSFRRSISLEETHRKSMRVSADKRSPNQESGHWGTETSSRTHTRHETPDTDRQPLAMDGIGSDHLRRCNGESITLTTGRNGMAHYNEDQRHSPVFFLFDSDNTQLPSRRATMDSTKLPKHMTKRKNTSFCHNVDANPPFKEPSPKSNTASLSRDGVFGTRLRHSHLSFPNSIWAISGDSGASSEESIGTETKVKRHHSDRYLKKQAAFDSLDDSRNPALKKGPIDKIRKSLKHVGKTSSSPIPGAEEMAERTWGPNGNCTWSNMSGRKMQLGSTRLQSLSELECDALQKVAMQRLTESDLGVAVVVPKDDSKVLNRKISMRKKYAVHLSTRDKNKEKGSDRVFGIPLVDVVENDQLLRLQKSAAFATTLDFSVANDGGAVNEETPPQQQSGDSCSSSCSGSVASINQQQHNLQVAAERPCIHKCIQKASSCESLNIQDYASAERDSVFSSPTTPNNDGSQALANSNTSSAARPLKRRGAIAADSLNEIDPYQSQLLEALSLSVSGKTHNHRPEKKRSLLPPTMAQVPYVVQKCCDHISKYGLDVTGIFRVAGSKKRVKQLREEFDRGFDVTIDEDYNPHDVAALLKEFIRDLPEALLTRELYHAFIQTAKLPKSERLPTLRSLVWLLPLTNRDTLFTLLSFLAVVAAHSEDSVDSAGKKVPGNKMGVSNLATIFGPNILHRYKKSPQTGNDNQYQVQSLEKAEDSSAVITVVEEIISNHTQLFQIVKYDHDQMLRTLNDTDPEAVDFLLRRKAANYMREKSKLLTNQSKPNRAPHHNTPSIANSNNNNNRVQLSSNGNHSPKLTDVTECCACEENGNNSADDNAAEQKQHSSMRLSYQQATGHVAVTSKRDSTEKGGKLKFKRPFFKRSNQPPASGSDLDERNEGSNNSSESDDAGRSGTGDTLTMLGSGQSFEAKRTQADRVVVDSRVSSSSVWSLGNNETAAGIRSMSFTEDDLHDILQPSDRASPQSSRSNASITPQLESEKSQSAHSSIPDLLDDQVFNEGKVNHDEVSVTQSSDSGVCVDNFNFSPQPPKDAVKRRGGFSLKQTIENVLDHTDFEAGQQESDIASVHDSKSASTDSLLSMDEDRPTLTPGLRKTSKDVCPPYKEAPLFTSKMSVKFSANLNNNNSNNNNNNNNSNSNSNSNVRNAVTTVHASQFTRRSSQVIRLCDNNEAAIVQDQNSSKSHETKRTEISNSVELNNQHVAQETSSRTRNRLPSSLSPRLHRQYGASATGNTTTRRTRVRGNKANMDDAVDDSTKDGEQSTEKRIRNMNGLNRGQTQQRQHMSETILAETTQSKEYASILPKATTKRPTQQHAPNATNPSAYRTRHGRRYSKDDLSISSKPNGSASKWTASGLIPRNINLNSSFNGGQFAAERSAAHLQSVRDDQSRLPETWV